MSLGHPNMDRLIAAMPPANTNAALSYLLGRNAPGICHPPVTPSGSPSFANLASITASAATSRHLLSWMTASTHKANMIVYQLLAQLAMSASDRPVWWPQKLQPGPDKEIPEPMKCVSPPSKVLSRREPRTVSKGEDGPQKPTKKRQRRKLTARVSKQETDDKSPVSGVVIKKFKVDTDDQPLMSSSPDVAGPQLTGDIDVKLNVVDRSESSQQKLAQINNLIGEYLCRLCLVKYSDAYGLAEHRCPSIVYIEYKCPECLKVFNCPANLASHRRWHKPRESAPKSKPSPEVAQIYEITDG